MSEPTDVVLLTHDRLDHLVRTVEALRQRTPEPLRLTVVDNASGPAVRTWLSEHRAWFHQILPRATNDHVPAFQHGIDATTSDPYVVTDPDLVVPDLSPSWLARLRDLLDRHRDFGLIGVELDPVNSPLTPEEIAVLRGTAHDVDGELREGNVGTHLQLIRRDALREPYSSDREVCDAVRRAGWRVGWAPAVQALHLGFDDVRAHPEYLRRKDATGRFYPSYANVLAHAERTPSLTALARAAPVLAATRGAGVADAAVLEIAWAEPLLGGVVAGPVSERAPRRDRLPYDDGAAGAVVLTDPPAQRVDALLAEARRVATHAVVLVAPLATVRARLTGDLAAPGWRAAEGQALGALPEALARAGDAALADRVGLSTLEHREHWLTLFAHGSFGDGDRRLFTFTSDDGAREVPETVAAASPARRGWKRLQTSRKTA